MKAEHVPNSSKPAWIVHPASSRAFASEAPSLATVFTNGSGHVVRHANAEFCRLAGRPLEALVDRPLTAALASEAAHELAALLDEVFETGAPSIVLDIAVAASSRTPLASGTSGAAGASRASGTRYMTALASRVESEETGEQGLLVHLLDTTERVQARLSREAAARDARLANEALVIATLREQETAERARIETERWNALVANLNEGVTVLDANGRVVLLNDVGRRLLGIERDDDADYIERCVLESVDGRRLTPSEHPASRARAGESFTDDELVLVRADGARHRLLFSGSAVRDASGIVLAINVYRDVTELRALEETRSEYVSLVSHDLRSPLQALLGNAELLVETLDAGADPARVRTRAETILRVTKRMAAMVDDLYRSSELESSKIELARRPVAVPDLLAGVYESVADAKQRARVRFDLATDLPVLRIDAPKIERALMNLITNALKYSSSEVTVAARAGAGEATFAVCDKGPGIPAEEAAHVFEKYRRTRAARTRTIEGLGLGLYIAKRIVDLHGGRIECESELGQGSTFRIRLPVDAPPGPA